MKKFCRAIFCTIIYKYSVCYCRARDSVFKVVGGWQKLRGTTMQLHHSHHEEDLGECTYKVMLPKVPQRGSIYILIPWQCDNVHGKKKQCEMCTICLKSFLSISISLFCSIFFHSLLIFLNCSFTTFPPSQVCFCDLLQLLCSSLGIRVLHSYNQGWLATQIFNFF